MRFAIVSIFPGLIDAVMAYGVVGRAFAQGLAELRCFDPRDHAKDRHKRVDDRPYGGGPGMVMQPGPLVSAIEDARDFVGEGATVVCLSPSGDRFDRDKAAEYAKKMTPTASPGQSAVAAVPGIVLLAGRYEGIDERVIEGWVDEELSVGDFVVSGGELPALIVIDAVLRHCPGVLGHELSAVQDSFEQGLLDCPHYTRPESFQGQDVPSVLLSGDHQAIERWRRQQALSKTARHRPDLLDSLRQKGALSGDDLSLLGDVAKDE
ncbi:MAG: tRNA (guanosine(37)-N1)-methyltransferase TrmD [Pseudomonadota bacterium]